MASAKNVALPEDLLTAASEAARPEGKTTAELIEAATRRYLARERLDGLVRHGVVHVAVSDAIMQEVLRGCC